MTHRHPHTDAAQWGRKRLHTRCSAEPQCDSQSRRHYILNVIRNNEIHKVQSTKAPHSKAPHDWTFLNNKQQLAQAQSTIFSYRKIMKNKSLVSISDLNKDEILRLLSQAEYFEKNPNQKILDGKVVATLFFEPSTRTRLSFETAVNRLGGRVIGFSDAKTSSQSKGETLKDTIMMVSNYADLIVMRHYLEGAARYASEFSPVPIINAGDGANQHPSQTMLDLYSIYKTQGTLENQTITMVGDLKYGRTVHSLLEAMYYWNPTFNFIACKELQMPEQYKRFCDEHGIKYNESTEFSQDVINSTDILYMTRVQQERFTDLMEYERVKSLYNLNNSMLANSKPNLRVLHPLPRITEISQDVDDNPKAYYFQQAKNGLYARQAIICRSLGIEI